VDVEIIRVGPADAGLFRHVAEDVFDYRIDPAGLADYLVQPGHHLFVALCDGLVVGQLTAVLHRHPDLRPTELYMDEVGVSPDYQRRGIASRLLDAAFTLGRDLGCAEAWLGTEPDNAAARGLYRRRADPAEDALIYVFKL